MIRKFVILICGIVLLTCFFSCAMAELTGERITQALSDKEITVPVVCDQPYALCDTAYCVPAQDDPSKVLCSCYMVDGPSLGGNNCSVLAPIGMYVNEYGDWMIKAGYPVGQITSTYSFYHAAPIEGNEIDPNNTSPDYSGDIYLKQCMNGDWADCWNKPCSVLPQDIHADINTDRLASEYAVCNCGLVVNSSEWFIGVYGTEQCEDETLCNDYIISGANVKSMDPGIVILKRYLQENPDPNQQYTMGYCEGCVGCDDESSDEPVEETPDEGVNETSDESVPI
ncbi:hypothetical protein KHC33_06810 [Methanospirillum sp. J.3.6.1-F.2.7.3]|uniref:Uncharacterized protein n=1 Tax=Methanospirillum purgamenti TaxID=2834276 RepID=A0A8E7B3C8_9EURY|nr:MULTISPECIES: hypothetical protein [Methanospirillum]MDX8550897.1 hypothetical protein [Methanospirillum hungatei]QVV90189.1 hypothetical protein KHC33_06810 [Methanospirillum sp. J.3.6.1-F.2.7.3]